MSRLVKFFWFLSIIIFLITLLFVYAYLPARVGINTGPGGLPDEFIDRSTFFYGSIGLFLLANVPIYILRKLLEKTWMEDRREELMSPARMKFRQNIIDWLLAFATALNVFFVLGMIYLGVFNSAEDLDIGLYAPLVYAGPLLIGILFLVLIYIFVKKKTA